MVGGEIEGTSKLGWGGSEGSELEIPLEMFGVVGT